MWLQIKGVSKVEITDGKINIEALSGENVYSDFIDIMKLHQLRILSMDTKEADLESVFLQLTGRELRD